MPNAVADAGNRPRTDATMTNAPRGLRAEGIRVGRHRPHPSLRTHDNLQLPPISSASPHTQPQSASHATPPRRGPSGKRPNCDLSVHRAGPERAGRTVRRHRNAPLTTGRARGAPTSFLPTVRYLWGYFCAGPVDVRGGTRSARSRGAPATLPAGVRPGARLPAHRHPGVPGKISLVLGNGRSSTRAARQFHVPPATSPIRR